MTSNPLTNPELIDLRARAAAELRYDILPFWERHAFDERGWIVGTVLDDLTIEDDVPRHSVLVARILWTFAAAARAESDPELRDRWLAVGRTAYTVLTTQCWDQAHGGVMWSLTPEGHTLDDRKQVYAQAFCVFALAEWYAATSDAASLSLAMELVELLETHSRDHEHGGYVEAHSREWGPLENMALSDRDLNVPKSMNTNLHVLEAYSTLLRAGRDSKVRDALADLLLASVHHIYGTDPWPHCRLFFDMEWRSIVPTMSYGHDIEASWLMWDAWLALQESGLADDALGTRTREVALALANAVKAHGVDADGGVMYEGVGHEITVPEKHWWPQAEGVVGWLNAYELSGDTAHRDAALAAWNFIEQCVIDREHGEWFAVISRDGTPDLADPSSRKMGPWKCCYHNARACLEVMRRVDAGTPLALST